MSCRRYCDILYVFSMRHKDPSHSFCREAADILCEELVLLEEDLRFVSELVPPSEVDPYTSNQGDQKSDTHLT